MCSLTTLRASTMWWLYPSGVNLNPDITSQLTIATAPNRRHILIICQCLNYFYFIFIRLVWLEHRTSMTGARSTTRTTTSHPRLVGVQNSQRRTDWLGRDSKGNGNLIQCTLTCILERKQEVTHIRNTDQELKNYPPKGKFTFAIVASWVNIVAKGLHREVFAAVSNSLKHYS
jgi:hypothetical protein